MTKTSYDKVVACFRDVLIRPPASWFPSLVPPHPNPLSSNDWPPTSLWKGEGWSHLGPRFRGVVG